MQHDAKRNVRRWQLTMAFAAVALLQAPQLAQAQQSTSLDQCPARQPLLRIATVSGDEIYSAHPAESRFSSTHYARLAHLPLFGADPLESKMDLAYGVAESYEYLPGATGMRIKMKPGLSFNDGSPVTVDDIIFSIEATASTFADTQISGTLRGIGVKAKAIDDRTVEIDFSRGSPTFHLEMSPLVFPLYVMSKKYHSGGDISQAAFDKFRAAPLNGGPYRIAARQTQQFITLQAARKDPLLGCPLYDRIEIRHVAETGTRVNQLRTGQQDIVTGTRELAAQVRRVGASVATKTDANVIGFYFFHTDRTDNVFHNADLRRAAAHAIDHKLLADTIWNGVGVRTWGCTWPPPTEISTENPRYLKACGAPYAYDPEKAKKLLAAAGYQAGKSPPVTLEYSMSYPEEGAMAEAMEPMLKAVGFNVRIERTDLAERNRRRHAGAHVNSLLFFGPGGRVTALAGVHSVYGPTQGWGPKHDKDVVTTIERASRATSIEEYTNAVADLGELVHDRAYGPGFFSAGSVFFLRKGIADWGIEKSVGRGPINLTAFVTRK